MRHWRNPATGNVGRGKICLAAISFALFLAAAGPGIAGDLKIVGGYVDTVSGYYVFLHGKSYDIEGAHIENPSGKTLSADSVSRGKKVDFFFRGGKLTTVLVYDPMPE